MALGIIGILVALVLFLLLVYKGCSSYWVAAVCAIIVALTNGMNVVDAITGPFLTGLVDMINKLFSVIFLGAILGKLYTDTGAASSIAHTLTSAFVTKRQGKSQVAAAMIVLTVVAGLCTLGGIDGYVLTFTMFPICLVMAEMCDIPRRFIPGMFCLNCGFMIAPGAPQIYNVMAGAAIGSQAGVYAEKGAFGIAEQLGAAAGNSASALVPGIVASAIVVVCGCITLISMINKAKAKGEHFDYGTIQKFDMPERKMPHFVLAILPLLLVFVLYTIVKLNIFLALLGGVLLALVTMFPYITKNGRDGKPLSLIKSIVGSVNDGANTYPGALMSVSTPAALAGVITATGAFGMIVGVFGGLQVHPLVLTIIVVCVVVAITSAPPVALMVSLPMVIGILAGPAIAAAGANAAAAVLPFSAEALFRVGVVAASTFETLPINGLIVLGLGLAHTSHKESYKPMFLMTVVYTFIATIVCALLCLIPGLV